MENNKKSNVVLQKYEIGKFLGQGNFAKVYQAKSLETGQTVAVKVIDKEKVLKAGLTAQTETEISAMTKLKHQNIVELYEVMATKTKIYMVMEYAKGGELFDKISKVGRLAEAKARRFFRQLITAVDYCHTRGVFHRDLKPENLLLDDVGDLKVSDFGLSAVVNSHSCGDGDVMLRTCCGTPAYAAPEVVFRRGSYDGAKADVWSCGVILFVLLAGYLPFHDHNLTEMYKKIGRGRYRCPTWITGEPRRLLSRMLNPNPSKRISMTEIMQNSWFLKDLNNPNNTANKRRRVSSDSDSEDHQDQAHHQIVVATSTKPAGNLNAFDIISLSSGLDLSGLFGQTSNPNTNNKNKDSNNNSSNIDNHINNSNCNKRVRFSSESSSATIAAKFEEIAASLRLRGKEYLGKKRRSVLSIEAEIYEFAPKFHMVELKKSSGDTLEYRSIMENDIRPGLKDIVWTWQGEDKHVKDHKDTLQMPKL